MSLYYVSAEQVLKVIAVVLRGAIHTSANTDTIIFN